MHGIILCHASNYFTLHNFGSFQKRPARRGKMGHRVRFDTSESVLSLNIWVTVVEMCLNWVFKQNSDRLL